MKRDCHIVYVILQELVSTIDFRYITDVVTKEEAINLLKKMKADKDERIQYLMEHGYPAYTTQVGTINQFIENRRSWLL